MAKTKISEFSSTPANNTDIDSINIAEGCAPSNINDAIRELMAQLKDFQTGAQSDSFNGPIGTTTAAAGAFTTLSASSTLSVTGAGSIQGLTVGRGAGAVSTNTAVGASALAANTTGDVTVAVGYLALQANTTGSANSAIGRYALYSNTTASYNSAFGYNSLFSNTTGANNVALGTQALVSNTTASNNVAVGYQAAYSNQTGTSNTLVGYTAGYAHTANDLTAIGTAAALSNTTGSDNSALGVSALRTNTTGSYNTALGRDALRLNTTASNNTAVGYAAGYNTTTGTAINAFGAETLYSNTTGLANSAFGGVQSGVIDAALRTNTTGSYNVAFGTGALCSNTTASYNTAVGYKAGATASTASYNTFIGYFAGQSTTGEQNTFLGKFAGNLVTTGTLNTIIGAYNGNQGGLDIRTASNYIVLSDGGGTPRGIFDGSGNWLVGMTSYGVTNAGVSLSPTASSSFYVAGGTALTVGRGTSDGTAVQFNRSGTNVGSISVTTTATAYNTSSDYRLKNTIVPMTGALAKVAQLKPVTYKWNVDGSDGEGFIAHELAEVVPQCVTGEKDAVDEEGNPKYQGIDTSFLVATLTAAIQELKAEFDAYKASHP